MGFVDPAGQRINASKAAKDGTLSVEDTEFVRQKIHSGELTLIEDDKKPSASNSRQYSDKEKKVIFQEAEEGIGQMKALIKSKDLKSEFVDQVEAIIEEVEQAIKAKDADRVIEAMAKAEEPMIELMALAQKK